MSLPAAQAPPESCSGELETLRAATRENWAPRVGMKCVSLDVLLRDPMTPFWQILHGEPRLALKPAHDPGSSRLDQELTGLSPAPH